MSSLVSSYILPASLTDVIGRVIALSFFAVFAFLTVAQAQEIARQNQAAEIIVIENSIDSDVLGFNKNIVVKGSVTKGVLTFGGDVTVEGRVEGDVATFGGSVIQQPDSFIGGDVLVFGGSYHHGKSAPLRNPASHTVIYAGFGDELREIAQNPVSLAAPDFTPTYFALRILNVLFWFVVSFVLTTISPNAIGRAVARLKMTSLRLAIIGGLATIICTIGVEFGLRFLPAPFSVAVGLMTLALLFLAYVFGRVCIHAATGKFLQKRLLGDKSRSESMALLLGAVFWTLVLSIPFVWTAVFIGMLIVSFGIVLTARPIFNPKFER